MSDTFNHFHYLDKRLINSEASDEAVFDLENILTIRKKIFLNFKFIISNHSHILYSDFPHIPVAKINNNIELNIDNNERVFWLKLHNTINSNTDKIILNSNTTLVHEDFSLQKSNHKTTIINNGENEYYYFSHNLNEQLFINEISFEIRNKLKTFFMILPNFQKQKNKIDYLLKENSILEHSSFCDIKEGQLQDDSIEIIHEKKSTSIISYESLNKGKICSQINSIILKDSEKCSTTQKIKHIVLNDKAITNSKPNLMIENSDVIASHGNSIGAFNKEDLFYLEQRGLNIEKSYTLLSESKRFELIDKTTISDLIFQYCENHYE